MKKLCLLSSLFLLITGLTAQTVIFEEQFDGGLPADWEVGPGTPEGAVWQWSDDGSADDALVDGELVEALFWGTNPPIASPSVDNGVAMYNSDVYDGGGVDVGAGPFPGVHSGTLITPSIDCSDFEFVSVKMNQYARANANAISTILEVSNDGGETWTPFVINPNVVGNGSTDPDNVLLVNISSVAGNQADVKVRLTWNGRYYFWLVDDFQLIETPANDLALGDFFYPPASYAQPESRVVTDTMGFSADISNLGGVEQTNVVLRATVRDNEDNILYQDSVVLDALAPGVMDSTVVIENQFVPDMLTAGQDYSLTYDVYTLDDSNDFNALDNTGSEGFIVTEFLYAMDDGAGIGGVRAGDGGDYAYGNLYQMGPFEEGMFNVGNISFSVADGDDPIGGTQVSIFMYKVSDEVLPDFSNFDDSSTGSGDDDLELVGFQNYEFEDDYEDYDVIDIEILNLLAEPGVPLEPNARYFIVVNYEGNAAQLFAGTDGGILYFQISTLVQSGGTWFLGGFGEDNASDVRLEMALANLVDDNPLPEAALTVFPNPTVDHLNIQLDLEAPSDATVVLADINGKVIDVRNYQSIQRENINMTVNTLPAGTYLVRVATDEGTSTKKIVIQK